MQAQMLLFLYAVLISSWASWSDGRVSADEKDPHRA